MVIKIEKFSDLYKTGVYQITNSSNGKIYIGSTIDTFMERWRAHIKKLRNNKHSNAHLQNAFNKYSEDSFVFTILEIIKGTEEEIRKAEQEYLDKTQAYNRKIGYNIEISVSKQETSEETKKKISETLKRKFASGEIQPKNDPSNIAGWNKGLKCPQIGETRRQMFGSIEVYNKHMELIVTFRSVADLCEWSEANMMPELEISASNKKGGVLRADKIHLSARKGIKYKGLYFKKNEESLSPEMGIAKWVNYGNGEIPNPQPSAQLTECEGPETND